MAAINFRVGVAEGKGVGVRQGQRAGFKVKGRLGGIHHLQRRFVLGTHVLVVTRQHPRNEIRVANLRPIDLNSGDSIRFARPFAVQLPGECASINCECGLVRLRGGDVGHEDC